MSNDNQVPTFRFNFSEEFNKELGYFSKLHKHEDRIDFKENWQKWIEDNEDLINEEKKRLKNLGYEGNIENKMYTSVRYYFRKKTSRPEQKQGEREKKRERVVVSKELLQQIEQHIKNNNFNENYTPQIAYEEFYNQYSELITNVVESAELNIDNDEFLQNKIKKIYKNKFYVIIRKKNNSKSKTQIIQESVQELNEE